MLPIIQLILLFITTILLHIATTNPNASTASDYVVNEGFAAVIATRFAPNFGKFLIWSSTLYQMLYLYLSATSSPLISSFYPEILTVSDPLPFTFTSSLGYILMMIGGLGRIWCYKTLGKFFTFEITIRNSHKLIKSGPYAYVRHPSYTFAGILVTGLLIVHRRLVYFFPSRTWGRIFMSNPGILLNLIIFAVFVKWRVAREEEELEKRFGKEWKQYSMNTKRFIPGIL